MTLDEARANIGAGVVYRPYPGAQAEDGAIIRVSARYVFVHYRGDTGPKATAAECLTLLADGRA